MVKVLLLMRVMWGTRVTLLSFGTGEYFSAQWSNFGASGASSDFPKNLTKITETKLLDG